MKSEGKGVNIRKSRMRNKIISEQQYYNDKQLEKKETENNTKY